mgnify:CR=1 FL=1
MQGIFGLSDHLSFLSVCISILSCVFFIVLFLSFHRCAPDGMENLVGEFTAELQAGFANNTYRIL